MTLCFYFGMDAVEVSCMDMFWEELHTLIPDLAGRACYQHLKKTVRTALKIRDAGWIRTITALSLLLERWFRVSTGGASIQVVGLRSPSRIISCISHARSPMDSLKGVDLFPPMRGVL